jgi:hypothetical protein
MKEAVDPVPQSSFLGGNDGSCDVFAVGCTGAKD